MIILYIPLTFACSYTICFYRSIREFILIWRAFVLNWKYYLFSQFLWCNLGFDSLWFVLLILRLGLREKVLVFLISTRFRLQRMIHLLFYWIWRLLHLCVRLIDRLCVTFGKELLFYCKWQRAWIWPLNVILSLQSSLCI